MKKIFIVLQIFIKCTLIFLISFIWSRFIFKELWISVIISTIITLFIQLISVIITRKIGYKKHLKVNEKELAENMFLSLSSDLNQIDFFFNLANVRHKNIIKNKKYIKITHDNNLKVILYPLLKFKTIQIDDINEIIKECKKDNPYKIVITCNEYDKQCLSFVRNFDFEIILLDKYETYTELYKEYEYFPKVTLKYKKEIKKTFKDLMAYSFNKTRTKGYVISSLILFLSSFFVKINIYYCITASLLLLFALISYTNPRYNLKPKSELL